MATPEGYRKAVRLMELADRFGLPVIALVDTAGAYPGIEAEERGQAEAIARSTDACLSLGVPMSRSSSAKAAPAAPSPSPPPTSVLMLEHCDLQRRFRPKAAASILWRDRSRPRMRRRA